MCGLALAYVCVCGLDVACVCRLLACAVAACGGEGMDLTQTHIYHQAQPSTHRLFQPTLTHLPILALRYHDEVISAGSVAG